MSAAVGEFNHPRQSKADGKVVDLRGANLEKFEKLQRHIDQMDAEKSFLENLLQIEAKARAFKSLQELMYFTVNELRSILPCHHILLMRRSLGQSHFAITAVSDLAEPDPRTPALQRLTKEFNGLVEDLFKSPENSQTKTFKLKLNPSSPSGFDASCGILAPLIDREGTIFAVLVFLSDKPFSDASTKLATRLGSVVANVWLSFDNGRPFRPVKVPQIAKILMILAMITLAFVPVPLMVLAPVKVIPDDPELVSSPLAGVIDQIAVQPNSRVASGTVLFSLEKTDAMNLLAQAEQNLAIANAKFQRASQSAFGLANGRKDLAVAKAELDLAMADRKAAARKLALTEIRAQKPGVVLFEDQERWIGKPVSIGERVMKIADPTRIKFRIDLPTNEAIILSDMKSARIFLDADPLNPFLVSVDQASYEAKMSDANVLSFPIYANPYADNPQAKHPPKTSLRIGLRGTAQLFGEKVPIWFFLFRKPLSFLRQWTGI